MNLILFTEQETAQPLPLADPRAVHILRTLRRQIGDVFDAGVINGPKGKAILREFSCENLILEFHLQEAPPPLHPISLLVGLSRPQTMRKILQETTSLGIGELHFVATEKGEPSYAESKLWSTGEFTRHLTAGAEQAFTTRIPSVRQHASLADALDDLQPTHPSAIALDNYEATGPLRDFSPTELPCFLAVGSERGWSARERDLFRNRNIPLLQLGTNVLRTETATLCGLSLILASRKLL